jgi:hypothetical protein
LQALRSSLSTSTSRTGTGRASGAPARQVQPSHKKRAKLARRPPDSSDDEDTTHPAATDPAAAASGVHARKSQPFHKNRVLLAVLGREAPGALGTKDENTTGCAQRLPSFFPPEVQQRWVDWAARTPSTLAEVPEEHRLRQCRMPNKCLPAGAATVVEARVQRELITYSNSDGRSIGKTTLARDADATRPLWRKSQRHRCESAPHGAATDGRITRRTP